MKLKSGDAAFLSLYTAPFYAVHRRKSGAIEG